MINSMKSMIVVGGLFVVSGAIADPCENQEKTAVEVTVLEAPIVFMQDITRADLEAMSARLKRQPAHQVLGFYAGIVGYKVDSLNVNGLQSANGPACLMVQLKAELVVVDRRIAVASDLNGSPCQLRAALEHYQHHAATASLALHRFAADLQGELRSEIDVRTRYQAGTAAEFRQYIDKFLDDEVDTFSDSLLQVQKDTDTESEIRGLAASCNL